MLIIIHYVLFCYRKSDKEISQRCEPQEFLSTVLKDENINYNKVEWAIHCQPLGLKMNCPFESNILSKGR